MRGSSPQAQQINEILAERLATAEAAAYALMGEGRGFDADTLKRRVEAALHPALVQGRARPLYLLEVLQAQVERYRERGQAGTADAYASALETLRLYSRGLGYGADGRYLPASDVTPRFIRDYDTALRAKLRPNTVRKKIGTLRTLTALAISEASGEERETLEAARSAMASVRLKSERVVKDRLSIAQVEALMKHEFTGFASDARDMFCFAFYAGGMRRGDVLTLRWSNVDLEASRITWTMTKTGGKVVVPIVDGARELLERWSARTGPGGGQPSPFVFGQITEADVVPGKRLRAVDRRGSLLNKYCREKLAPTIGAKPFTMHVARHSLADHLRKSGVALTSIMMTLGHTTPQMTQRYLAAFDTETVAAGMREALGHNASTPLEPSPDSK
jgi:integrase